MRAIRRNPDTDFIGFLKDYYKPGMRIRLIETKDPQSPNPGTEGIIQGVDEIGNVLVHWSNGSALSLIPAVDRWEEIL